MMPLTFIECIRSPTLSVHMPSMPCGGANWNWLKTTKKWEKSGKNYMFLVLVRDLEI